MTLKPKKYQAKHAASHRKWAWLLLLFTMSTLPYLSHAADEKKETEDDVKKKEFKQIKSILRKWSKHPLADRKKEENRPKELSELLEDKNKQGSFIDYLLSERKFKRERNKSVPLSKPNAKLISALVLEDKFSTDVAKKLLEKKHILYKVLLLHFFIKKDKEILSQLEKELKEFIKKLNLTEIDIHNLLSFMQERLLGKHDDLHPKCTAQVLHFLISNFPETISFDKIPNISDNEKSDITKINNWIDYLFLLCNTASQNRFMLKAFEKDLSYIFEKNLLENDAQYKNKEKEIEQKLEKFYSTFTEESEDNQLNSPILKKFTATYLLKYPSKVGYVLQTVKQKNPQNYASICMSIAYLITEGKIDKSKIHFTDTQKGDIEKIRKSQYFAWKEVKVFYYNRYDLDEDIAKRHLYLTYLSAQDPDIAKVFYISWYFSEQNDVHDDDENMKHAFLLDIAKNQIEQSSDEDKANIALILYQRKDWRALTSARVNGYIEIQKLKESQKLTSKQIAVIDVYTTALEKKFISDLIENAKNSEKDLYRKALLALRKEKNNAYVRIYSNETTEFKFFSQYNIHAVQDALKENGIFESDKLSLAFDRAGISEHTPEQPLSPINIDSNLEIRTERENISREVYSYKILKFSLLGLLGIVIIGFFIFLYRLMHRDNKKEKKIQSLQRINQSYYLL